jgi:Ca-activated chloride channel homolog
LMVDPPALQSLDDKQLPARELILVVDTSGSMHGTSIEQARAALRLALQQLRPRDSFNLIRFNDRFARLFAQSVPADSQHLAEARRYVDSLQAEGGTEMQPAMHAALSAPARAGALRQVVFLTDGDIGNEQALFDTIRSDLGDARLFPVGIGSAPNGYFMTRAAAAGRGSYTFIGDIGEVRERMQSLFERLSAPVLTDIQVTWKGADALEQTPARVPDLYAGEPLWLSVRSKTSLQSVTIEGTFDGRPWRREIALDGGARARGVHVLWARRRIAEIMATRGLGQDAQQVREQVLEVALQHHLVSQYTSLVAVDKTPARPADKSVARKPIPTHLPAGWSQAHVTGMPQTATPAMLHSLLGLAILLFTGLLARRRTA